MSDYDSGTQLTPDQVAIPAALPPPQACRYCDPLECLPDYHDASARIHEYLRGQANRPSFEERLAQILAAAAKKRAERQKNPIALGDKTMSLAKLIRKGKAKNGSHKGRKAGT